MKVKQKKCSGTRKAKGHGCGKVGYPFKYGLGTCCYPKWLYSTPEGLKCVEAASIKATSDRTGLERMEKEITEHRNINTVISSLATRVHKYIRLRDRYKPCISCGTHWNIDFQAGHYYKAELYPSIKFNEFNISGQCRQCNLRKDGNFDGYTTNLPNRIGNIEFDQLVVLAELEKKEDFKWNREKLKEIREYYKEKAKELKET